MIRRGDKRGSHIGVVISFAIFVAFLIFLYTLAQPSFQQKEQENALRVYLEKTLIENVSSELTIITVNVSSSSLSECISLDGLIGTFEITPRIFVWNAEQVSTQSGIQGNDLRIQREDPSDVFFKIHHSEDFPDRGSGSWTCENLVEGVGYDLGVTKVEKYIFSENVIALINDYIGRYEMLKDDLKIPDTYEFGFGLIYSGGNAIETPDRDVQKNIYIKEIPIQYVNELGKIQTGFLVLKIW